MTLKKDLIFNDNLKIYVQQNPGLCLFLAAAWCWKESDFLLTGFANFPLVKLQVFS